MLSIGSTRQVLPFITATGGSCLGSQFGTGGPSGGSLDVPFNFRAFDRLRQSQPLYFRTADLFDGVDFLRAVPFGGLRTSLMALPA